MACTRRSGILTWVQIHECTVPMALNRISRRLNPVRIADSGAMAAILLQSHCSVARYMFYLVKGLNNIIMER